MKPLSTFHIIPDIPSSLEPLWDLAYNLWWTWNQDAIGLFYDIDPEAWVASGRNPLLFLSQLSQKRLEQLAADPKIIERVQGLTASFEAYRNGQTWYGQQPVEGMRIAYFSAEFGLAESLPIYSGGLGILAGDHLKSASNLGLPLVGMGLLYRQGYFHQALNPDGWQLELYPENDFDQMPVEEVLDPSGEAAMIQVDYPTGPVYAKIWSARVGRVTLYLLDTNLECNRPEDQQLTALLYGGDREMRIRQEILLGIGGLRALHHLNLPPTICHMNEGHSAFQALERIRMLMAEEDLSFSTAREASIAGNVFTTHTPVPAGNDWFPPDLVETYLGSYRESLNLSKEELLGLGRIDPNNRDSDFCMTVLALRLSANANGVSRLHGEVSRKMWSGIWPNISQAEVPICSVTNGIHSQTWVSLQMADLFDRYLGAEWRNGADQSQAWEGIRQVPDEELWTIHQQRRQRLIEYTRFHLRKQFSRQGLPRARTERQLENLDPNALTIGFARRFATYKRGNLIFSDIQRLGALFENADRPVQILFAGKAHPHDHPGKELIREIVSLSRQAPFAGNVFFLEDYDMCLGRYLVQGCDVWLNNPRRPQEASGTSGMKAALNGAPNISILDGWWVEACELHQGWAIGRGEVYEDLKYQDEVESSALYDLLENEVVPRFYNRDQNDLPHEWIQMMKETIATLGPMFNTQRMVRQYYEGLYHPNQGRWEELNHDRDRTAKLSQWKEHVRTNWGQVRIANVEYTPPQQPKVGMRIPLDVSVELGNLGNEDVSVQLYMGKINAHHDITDAHIQPLEYRGAINDGMHHFAGEYLCQNPGSHGYTVRIVPNHPDLRDPLQMGLVHWAS